MSNGKNKKDPNDILRSYEKGYLSARNEHRKKVNT